MHNYGSPADLNYMDSRISGIITNKNEKRSCTSSVRLPFFCLFIYRIKSKNTYINASSIKPLFDNSATIKTLQSKTHSVFRIY